MLISPPQGATASTASAADIPADAATNTTAATPSFRLPGDASFSHHHARHMVLGTPTVVKATIKHLHLLGYAEPNDWSRLMSTGRANEVMVILTKRVEVS